MSYVAPSDTSDMEISLASDRHGQVSDAQLAEDLGISIRAVASVRRFRKIPPFNARKPRASREESEVAFSRCIPMLGVLPDSTIARLVNLSPHTIRENRRLRNVGPYRKAVIKVQQESEFAFRISSGLRSFSIEFFVESDGKTRVMLNGKIDGGVFPDVKSAKEHYLSL